MLPERQKFLIALLLLTGFVAYSFSIYVSLPVQPKASSPEVAAGKFAWQRYNCNACHQVYGLGGFLGPDLTNTYSLKGPEYIKAFIKSGTVTMPKFSLKEKEMNSLLAYLKDIDASGTADPRGFTINADGTINR